MEEATVRYLILATLLLAACNPVRGMVKLDTIPSGASVYLGDRFLGTTPVTWTVDLREQDRVPLRIVKEGYRDEEETFWRGWIRKEYLDGHYRKDKFQLLGGERYEFEVWAVRELKRAQ
jgi:hypothetical protein